MIIDFCRVQLSTNLKSPMDTTATQDDFKAYLFSKFLRETPSNVKKNILCRSEEVIKTQEKRFLFQRVGLRLKLKAFLEDIEELCKPRKLPDFTAFGRPACSSRMH